MFIEAGSDKPPYLKENNGTGQQKAADECEL